jgi:hypothetical protein
MKLRNVLTNWFNSMLRYPDFDAVLKIGFLEGQPLVDGAMQQVTTSLPIITINNRLTSNRKLQGADSLVPRLLKVSARRPITLTLFHGFTRPFQSNSGHCLNKSHDLLLPRPVEFAIMNSQLPNVS